MLQYSASSWPIWLACLTHASCLPFNTSSAGLLWVSFPAMYKHLVFDRAGFGSVLKTTLFLLAKASHIFNILDIAVLLGEIKAKSLAKTIHQPWCSQIPFVLVLRSVLYIWQDVCRQNSDPIHVLNL